MNDVTAMGWYSFNRLVKARQTRAALEIKLEAAQEACTCTRRCLPDCPTRAIEKDLRVVHYEMVAAHQDYQEFVAAFK